MREPWTEQEREAMRWAFLTNRMAFCTVCGIRVRARRAGPERDAAWVLSCPTCGRETTFPQAGSIGRRRDQETTNEGSR